MEYFSIGRHGSSNTVSLAAIRKNDNRIVKVEVETKILLKLVREALASEEEVKLRKRNTV